MERLIILARTTGKFEPRTFGYCLGLLLQYNVESNQREIFLAGKMKKRPPSGYGANEEALQP
jgi:hypothetical protein